MANRKKYNITFIFVGLLIFLAFVFHINLPKEAPKETDNIAIRFLTSGIEPPPTANPVIVENNTLKNELQQIKNERDSLKREIVSRGELNREAEARKQRVINAIENNLSGVFVGKASYIYQVSKENDVNPMLVSAIIKVETANGTSKLVKEANNPGGLNWFEGCKFPKHGWYQKFPSLDVGIDEMVRVLKDYYIDRGHGNIEAIGRKYAPPNDSRNGIGGMDNHNWSKMVSEYYNKILQEADL